MFFSWLEKLLQRPSRPSGRRGRPAKRTSFHLTVEGLEDRLVPAFLAPVNYAAATSPVVMMAGDFNGDGHADVITANAGTNNVSVLPGNGDGTFQAAVNSPLGGAPNSPYTGSQAGIMALADLNTDGRLDVAVVAGNSALVLLGNGDGSFQAPLSAYLGSGPTRMAAGDVNGDGRPDLFVADDISNTVNVLLGNGDGTFAPKVGYYAGPQPQDVRVADLDHDGKADLVAADAVSAGSVTVLLGNGDGTFRTAGSYPAFSAPYRMTLADFNGDGNDDVAVANSYTSSYVTILYGNGDGSFQPYHSYNTGSQPWDIQAADFDGDGRPDLVEQGGASYQVELNNGDGTLAAPTSTAGPGLDFAAADFNGDGTADIAGGNAGSVAVQVNTASAIVNVAGAVGFQVSAPATTVAGSAVPLTVTAVDAFGNVASGFLGTVHITSSDPRMTAQTYTFTAADAGTHTFAGGLALFTAGTQSVTATGPSQISGSQSVAVTPAAPSRFAVSADAGTVAGGSVAFTVTAQDAYGNLTPVYAGTVAFTSTDGQAGLPAAYTFTADDAGVHVFTATLRTASPVGQRIIATDAGAASFTGTSNPVAVTPAAASSLAIFGGGGHIGSAHPVTVYAYDTFGNRATGYQGAVHFTGSDPQIVLPADGSLINGVGTFLVTPMSLGAQTLTVTDTADATLNATETIVGNPGDAAHFVVTALSGVVAGTAQQMTVTAYDAFGNVAVDYYGTVAFTSSDVQAGTPGYYTFSAADAGVHTFTITLRTAGSQSLTVQDLGNAALTGSQSGLVVTPAAAVSLSYTQLQATTAGVAQSVTVTARDAYGNVATGYAGTVTFSSSDTKAGLPAAYTFTAADAGTHTFSVTLKTAGGQTFGVQDAANGFVPAVQQDIQVYAAAVAGFSFRSPSNATAGVAFTVTASAVDAYGNVVSGYTGKVHFTGPSGGGNLLPADYTFTAADAGVHVFSLTLASTGTQTVGIQDVLNGSLKGQFQISVKTGTTSGGGGTGGGTGGGSKKPTP